MTVKVAPNSGTAGGASPVVGTAVSVGPVALASVVVASVVVASLVVAAVVPAASAPGSTVQAVTSGAHRASERRGDIDGDATRGPGGFGGARRRRVRYAGGAMAGYRSQIRQ